MTNTNINPDHQPIPGCPLLVGQYADAQFAVNAERLIAGWTPGQTEWASHATNAVDQHYVVGRVVSAAGNKATLVVEFSPSTDREPQTFKAVQGKAGYWGIPKRFMKLKRERPVEDLDHFVQLIVNTMANYRRSF